MSLVIPIRLNRALKKKKKKPKWDNRHDKLIQLHENAKSHTAKPVKKYLEGVNWEILLHPPNSADIATSDFHLSRSMQSAFSGKQFNSYEDIKKCFDEWIG